MKPADALGEGQELAGGSAGWKWLGCIAYTYKIF